MTNIHGIVELRRKRANLVEQYKEVMDVAKEQKRSLSAEEEIKLDNLHKEERELAKQIEREEYLEERTKELIDNPHKAAQKEAETKPEYREAFKKWLIGGTSELTQEERAIMQEHRALGTGSGAAGGFTVPTGFLNELTEAMKWYGGMRNVARIMNTDSGNSLQMPTMNDTSNIGEIVAENATVGSQDVAFGQVSLGAYKYSSKMVLIPIELLQDSAFNIESYVAKALGQRIGRITNQHFTVGTGTSQPRGVVTDATSGKVGATGQTTSVTYDDVVDLIHSVDPAYRSQAKFMFNDLSLRNLKKLKDTQGRPLWVPGVAYKEGDVLGGYTYEVNNDMATMAANAKSLLFGDFSNYIIRNVMEIQTIRFGEKFMDNGQVGFLAFSRQDGRLLNAGTNPVAFYQNSAT